MLNPAAAELSFLDLTARVADADVSAVWSLAAFQPNAEKIRVRVALYHPGGTRRLYGLCDRDIVLATTKESGEGYAPDEQRRVDFLGSYPPGDMVLGELRGPMREETEQWLNRICMGLTTQHATAAEAHNRLMLTKAFDKSARLKRPIQLPIDSE